MDTTAEYKTGLLGLETIAEPNQKNGFAFLVVAWFLLLGFSYQAVLSNTTSLNLYWIDYILFGKAALVCLSFLFYIGSPQLKSKNWLSSILILSALAQSLFVVVETSQQVYLYSVVLLFSVLSAINYLGTFNKWLLWHFPGTLLSISFPYLLIHLNGVRGSVFSTHGNEVGMIESLALLCLAFSVLAAWLNAKSYKAHKTNQKLKQTLESVSDRVARGDIAKQVAHDIRSPLTALLMIESRDYMPEDHRNLLKSAVKRIDDNCSKLLAKNQTDEDKEENKLLSTAIDTVVMDVVVEKAMVHKNLKIELINDRTKRPYVSKVDGVLATNMISNLMNNAIDAVSSSEGHIKVKLEKVDGVNKIEIVDNGCGISKRNLKRLGGKGFSWGKKNKKDSGFGLGVASAKKWVKEWGGKIHYYSEVGKGTRVTVSLPCSM